jgi:Helix-hairpin-helix domain
MAACFRKLAEEAQKSESSNARFKANAFRKAATAVEAHPEKITSGNEAKKLAGIGKGSVALIDEFVEHGTMGERGGEGNAKEGKGGAEEGEGGEGKEKEHGGAKEAGGENDGAAAAKGGKKQGGLAFL